MLAFLANLLSLMGKHSESLNLYHKCVELDSNNVILYYNQARVLIKLERYEEALDAINIALVFDSNDIQFLNSKGILFYILYLKEILKGLAK
jgi:tetratricopeptide (TPR) repeat protein